MPEKMQGVYPILVTPFDEGGRVDVDSLRTLVDFQIDAGVHGIGVALGSGTDLAVHYSRLAEANGADALMLMPPSLMPVRPSETLSYFQAVSDAVSVPIFIQDTSRVHVSADLAVRIANECENVQYIKVESLPTTTTTERKWGT